MANIIKNEYDDCPLINIKIIKDHCNHYNDQYTMISQPDKFINEILKDGFYSDEKYVQIDYREVDSYENKEIWVGRTIIITNYGKIFNLSKADSCTRAYYTQYYYNTNQYISKILTNYLSNFYKGLMLHTWKGSYLQHEKDELIQQFVDDFNKDTVCSVSKFIERGEIEQQNKEQFEEINKLKTEIINKDVNILELQNKVKSLEANLQSLKQNTEEQITGLKTKLLDNHHKFINIHTNDYLQIRKLKETLEFANFMDGLKDHKLDYLDRVKNLVESENNLLSNKQIKQKSDDLIKLKLELDQFKKDLDIKHSLHITKTQELNKNKLELEQDKNNLETEYLNIKKWKKDLENLESKLNNKQTELKKHIKAFNKEKFNFKTKIIKKMGLIKDSDSDDNNSDNNTDDEY